MKNFILKFHFRIILLALLSLSALKIKAGDIKVKAGEAKLTVTQNSYTKLNLSNSIEKLSYRTVKTEQGLFTELTIPEYGNSNVIGDPKLPVLKKLIEIPVGSTPTVNVISYTVKEYKLSDYGILNKLIPAQPSVSKDTKRKLPDFKYNKTSYSTDQFNTNDLVSVDVLGIMRGERLGRINIAPVRYNPVTNTIQVYNDIVVEISYTGAEISKTIELKKNSYSLYFESMFGNQLLNYKPVVAAKDTMSKYPVKYVIVADPMFQAALQPFIQWKTKKGFTVVEAYTNNAAVGTTTASIKNYLQGLYNAGTPSDPAPSFVLFVGDIAQIPAFAGNAGSHVTDLYYCEYTGDYLPEVYYGRFSATTVAELQPQIDKTLEYEKYLMPDPSYLDQCVMIAGQDPTNGPLYGDGQINYGTSTYFNTAHGLTSHTYLFAVSGSSASQIISDVSNGVCMANYTAHGSSSGWADPSFSVSDVATLTNNHKFPLMVGNCCLTNKYDDPVCFGEALLRANGKGALGYIGGSNSSYWDEDYWWGCGYKTVVVNPTYNASTLGAYDRTFHDHGEHFGEWYASQDQMIFAGNLAVEQSGSSSCEYYWEIYCLMGDPSLMIYYSVPPALTVTYSPLIPLGSTSFTVNTEPYAYVAISMNGILYGAVLADSNGLAVVPLATISAPGTADVVATKQNRAPFISTVTVANPSGPYVLFNNKILHDVAGNNNGQADFGENITLDIALQNVGSASATGVSAKLRTNDPYVTLTDTTQSWGTVGNGITSTQVNAYSFNVANTVPDQHSAPFTIVITDGSSNTWTGTFNVLLNAPALGIGTVTVDDASGNGNGRLDPGENVNIIISSSNTGHAPASNTSSNLALVSGAVALNSATSNLGTLSSLTGTSNASFSVSVNPSAVIGSLVTFTNTLSSGTYSVQKPINLLIGLVDEDWETGNFSKFNWINGSNAWTIDNVAPYEGVYSSKSGTIVDSDSSTFRISFNVLTNDSISFYKKVSSESGYDFLKFYIDGTEKGSWSGTTDVWSRVVFAVTPGIHTFKWSYEKDYSYSGGTDCAWVDYILFPPVINVGVSVNDLTADQTTLNCYPNPFSQETEITYSLQKNCKVTVKVYNSVGQEIATLVNGETKQAGYYSTTLNAENLQSGIYHCVFSTDNKTIVQKLMILK